MVTTADFNVTGGGLTNGSNSFFLIHSTSGIVEGTDYDSDNDGKLELGSSEVVDSIAWKDRSFENDFAYGTNWLTQFDGSPDGVTRFLSDTTQKSSAWYNGGLNLTGLNPAQLAYDPANTGANFPSGGVLTPGAANYDFSPSTVVARRIFYNQSSWDGNTVGIDFTSDAAAIAPDKTA